MAYQRILTIQDISCIGQCSLTVALPILSACGLETAILPSAVLSTHTGGFQGFTFRDLTEDMPEIAAHWKKENLTFSAVYTGYLGSAKQIAIVKDIAATLLLPGGKKIIDPAMADNGVLYTGFDTAFVESMKTLVAEADVLLPNITEASLLTGMEYKEHYDEAYVEELLAALAAGGAKAVVMTGVSFEENATGVMVYENAQSRYYRHEKISRGCHGTGDVYASSFVGAYMNGKSMYDAAVMAADYTLSCIRKTVTDKDHWYGVKFEEALPELVQKAR